ncbi:hypothetical protein RINTHH_15350 [Richelia intracellularis HH01]|jgi:hypothetical protein|uniref:Uncharacterized protein n=1 Tax=Richelia intracellularis HH01 TaxID=1165094 RepID=M1X2Z6_9NOST|nr:hypothetical protein RINTHH_15350 [Richelia intracellularis HH01]
MGKEIKTQNKIFTAQYIIMLLLTKIRLIIQVNLPISGQS